MTQEKHDSFSENIPAYVLGALNRTEAFALRRHLETCPACRAELARYQQVGDGLLTALPLQVLPVSAKGKLLARLDEKKPRSNFKIVRGFGRFATAFVMLALVVTNLFAYKQVADLRRQQTQLADRIEKNHTLLGMLTADTEIHPVSAEGFTGNLLLDREKNLSYLLTWNLPDPPADRVYQIWLVSPNGERIDAGTFLPEADWPFTSTALVASRDFAEFVGIEVTVELLGGSESPTGEQVLEATY